MTIKISTRELLGMLSDVAPFASTSADSTENVVRLEWDGDRFTVSATDRVRVAREYWTPDEEEYDPHAEDAYVTYAVEDDTPLFSVRISLDDVKSIIKAFKLRGVKRQHAPLEIAVRPESFEDNTYRIKICRAAGDLWPALQFHAEGMGAPREGEIPEVDIESAIARTERVEAHLPGVAFNADYLAGFPKVRPLGPLQLSFTGENLPVRFTMGPRFAGVIQPTEVETAAHEHARQ